MAEQPKKVLLNSVTIKVLDYISIMNFVHQQGLSFIISPSTAAVVVVVVVVIIIIIMVIVVVVVVVVVVVMMMMMMMMIMIIIIITIIIIYLVFQRSTRVDIELVIR